MKTAVAAVVASVTTQAPVPAAPPAIVGRMFSSVAGRSLAGERLRVPEAAADRRGLVAGGMRGR
ncbi:MAG TPA: hypothetical protein PK435_00040 [Thermoanaerobaculaceae bacterium]|nr:hypothetical protein [Thermoanaerobaculaceae bacterium]